MEENTNSIISKANTWIKESITLKLFTIGVLILLLLIPASMITSLIRERENTSYEAIQEVSSKWGNAQTITGPVLVIPYRVHNQKGVSTEYAFFLPEMLHLNGELIPEERNRSIYKIVVYSSKMQFIGTFRNISFSGWDIPQQDILYNDAFIATGIPDLRGIRENIALNWNGSKYEFDTGIGNISLFSSGIKAKVKVNPEDKQIDFDFSLQLNGSQSINFIPVGKETIVTLNSKWKDPGFDGAFLPEPRLVNDEGFKATWKVLHFNRNFPQQWLSTEAHDLQSSSFGVNLLLPVDHYQKSYRSAKYAILIIALTFLVFFFMEILNRKKIHPIQYILVGLALCIFYTLLVSLSEQVGFDIAYWISASAIIALVSIYLKSVLENTRLMLMAAGILTILYGFIYSILQLQEYSLLAGSIGLFVALATVMYLSRKIDWYGNRKSATSGME